MPRVRQELCHNWFSIQGPSQWQWLCYQALLYTSPPLPVDCWHTGPLSSAHTWELLSSTLQQPILFIRWADVVIASSCVQSGIDSQKRNRQFWKDGHAVCWWGCCNYNMGLNCDCMSHPFLLLHSRCLSMKSWPIHGSQMFISRASKKAKESSNLLCLGVLIITDKASNTHIFSWIKNSKMVCRWNNSPFLCDLPAPWDALMPGRV